MTGPQTRVRDEADRGGQFQNVDLHRRFIKASAAIAWLHATVLDCDETFLRATFNLMSVDTCS